MPVINQVKNTDFFCPKNVDGMADRKENLLMQFSSVDYIRGLINSESCCISFDDLFSQTFYNSGKNVESNIDGYKSSGIYGINRDAWPNTNAPIVYGCLLVFNGKGLASGGAPIVQIALSHDAVSIKVRVCWINNWYAWRTL